MPATDSLTPGIVASLGSRMNRIADKGILLRVHGEEAFPALEPDVPYQFHRWEAEYAGIFLSA